MEFDLSDDQVALAEAARTFLASSWDHARLREFVGTPGEPIAASTAPTSELWHEMCDQGWLAVEVPEAAGGLGLGLVEVAVLCEEIGKSLAPTPVLAGITALDALRIARSRDNEYCDEWLDRLASGDATACVSLSRKRGALTGALDNKGGWVLLGRSDPVVHGPSSDLAIVVAGIDSTDQDACRRVAEADETAPGIVSSDPLCAGRAVFLIRLDNHVRPSAHAAMDRTRLVGRLETDGASCLLIGGPRAASRLVNRYVTGICAEMLGASKQVLDMTVAYAKERVQFGRPIGSFQAVKHRCADMLVDVEGMRSVAYYAAWCVGHDTQDSSEAASAAKTWCSEAAARVMSSGLQVHGGIGFTWEHDLHLYLKRSQLDQVSFGDAQVHRERLSHLLRAKLERGEPIL